MLLSEAGLPGRYLGRSHNVFEVPWVTSRRACDGSWRNFVLARTPTRKVGRETGISYYGLDVLVALFVISK